MNEAADAKDVVNEVARLLDEGCLTPFQEGRRFRQVVECVSGGFAGYHFGGTRGPVPPRVRGGGPNDAPREIRFKKERW